MVTINVLAVCDTKLEVCVPFINPPAKLIIPPTVCTDLPRRQSTPGQLPGVCVSRLCKAANCLLCMKHVKLSAPPPHLSNGLA